MLTIFPFTILSLSLQPNIPPRYPPTSPSAYPSHSLFASVINADAQTITYFVQCGNTATTTTTTTNPTTNTSLSSVDDDGFILDPPLPSPEAEYGPSNRGVTHIQGPSTMSRSWADTAHEQTYTIACQFTGATTGVCTDFHRSRSIRSVYTATSTDDIPASLRVTAGSLLATFGFSSSGTQMLKQAEMTYVPVVVTAGAQKVGDAPASVPMAKSVMMSMTSASRAGATSTGAAGRGDVRGLGGSVGALAVGAVALVL